jgi:AraC family transcriptional regulator
MHYARGRRLSEAARALAAGAPNILEVALAAGYGSHEAFTRAFRRQFGVPPEALRGAVVVGERALVQFSGLSILWPSDELKAVRWRGC